MKNKIHNMIPLIILMSFLLLCSGGCGGSKVRADAELEGKYIPVTGSAYGVTLVGDEIGGFDIELQSGGKATMTIDGDSSKVKWENDDTSITITVEGEKLIGTRGQDSFTIEDLLGMGLDVVFAKEGTEAAIPDQYLPETDRFLLGKWQSTVVTDVLDYPVDTMADDALRMEFSGDYTVTVELEGVSYGPYKWSNLGDWGSLDDADDLDLSWDITGEGIKVNYSTDDGDYYVFTCSKAG